MFEQKIVYIIILFFPDSTKTKFSAFPWHFSFYPDISLTFPDTFIFPDILMILMFSLTGLHPGLGGQSPPEIFGQNQAIWSLETQSEHSKIVIPKQQN